MMKTYTELYIFESNREKLFYTRDVTMNDSITFKRKKYFRFTSVLFAILVAFFCQGHIYFQLVTA